MKKSAGSPNTLAIKIGEFRLTEWIDVKTSIGRPILVLHLLGGAVFLRGTQTGKMLSECLAEFDESLVMLVVDHLNALYLP